MNLTYFARVLDWTGNEGGYMRQCLLEKRNLQHMSVNLDRPHTGCRFPRQNGSSEIDVRAPWFPQVREWTRNWSESRNSRNQRDVPSFRSELERCPPSVRPGSIRPGTS